MFDKYVGALTAASVQGSSKRLWDVFQAQTTNWPSDRRRRLLSRYLGFPVWDALVFPTVAAARLPQLSPIPVTRFSPLDASMLRAVDEDGTPRDAGLPKLDGVTLAHFGGFFSRAARENDYLWGRLDGAELILRLLARRALPDASTDAPIELTRQIQDALRRILSSERGTLTDIEHRLDSLMAQLPKDAQSAGEPEPGRSR